MCTRSYSGQHLVQGFVHRRLLIRVERVGLKRPYRVFTWFTEVTSTVITLKLRSVH